MSRSRVRVGRPLAVLVALTLATAVGAQDTIEEFGESVARALEQRDSDRFTRAVDRDALIDRAIVGIQANDGFISALRDGLENGLDRVGTILFDSLGPDAALTFVRTRPVEGVTRVLIRVDLGDRGINYLDLFVHERPDHSFGIYDWIDYVQGQKYSDSLRMVLALMVRQDPGLMGRLLGIPNVDRTLAEKIGTMGTLGRQGDWVGWLTTYRTLPEAVRANRVLLATRVAVAGATGDGNEYMNAMSDLHAHHGDDPTLSLTLVDYYLLIGEHDRAYMAVDRMDRYTGGDAALTNLRAGIALHQGDHHASIEHARRAISQDPGYEDPYWHLMVAGSRAGDFESAMQGVRALETRFGYSLTEDDLMESDEFAGLLASEEWRATD